jgi:hypothetical protein
MKIRYIVKDQLYIVVFHKKATYILIYGYQDRYMNPGRPNLPPSYLHIHLCDCGHYHKSHVQLSESTISIL